LYSVSLTREKLTWRSWVKRSDCYVMFRLKLTLTINEYIAFPHRSHQWKRQTELSAFTLRMRKFTRAKFGMIYIALNVRYLPQITLKYASLLYLTIFFPKIFLRSTLPLALTTICLIYDKFYKYKVTNLTLHIHHKECLDIFSYCGCHHQFSFSITEAITKQSLRHQLHTNAFVRKWKSIFDYTKWWSVVFYCLYIVKICQNMQLKINSL